MYFTDKKTVKFSTVSHRNDKIIRYCQMNGKLVPKLSVIVMLENINAKFKE